MPNQTAREQELTTGLFRSARDLYYRKHET